MTRLRWLVRRFHDGLDGAGAELLRLLDEERVALLISLGDLAFALPDPEAPDAVNRFVEGLERVFEAALSRRAEARMAAAERAAVRVVQDSVVQADRIELASSSLGDLVAIPVSLRLAFRIGGVAHVIDRVIVADMLSQVASAALDGLRLETPEMRLIAEYTTPRSRGRIALRLGPPERGEVCVLIDFDALPSAVPHRDPSGLPGRDPCDPRPTGPFVSLAGS